jgi:Tfp pilus assembly protein PilF
MSRALLPRRFSAAIPALAAVIAAVCVSEALSQAPESDPRAVTVIGNNPHARRCMAALAEADSSDRALGYCQRATNTQRMSLEAEVEAHINLGVMHMRRSEFSDAIAQFDVAIAAAPRNGEAHLNRGAALVQMREYGPAVASLTTALGLSVREPHKAYFNRGVARESLGDLRGAFEDYTTALEIQPDWGPANAELARFARGRRENLANRLGEPASTP